MPAVLRLGQRSVVWDRDHNRQALDATGSRIWADENTAVDSRTVLRFRARWQQATTVRSPTTVNRCRPPASVQA